MNAVLIAMMTIACPLQGARTEKEQAIQKKCVAEFTRCVNAKRAEIHPRQVNSDDGADCLEK